MNIQCSTFIMHSRRRNPWIAKQPSAKKRNTTNPALIEQFLGHNQLTLLSLVQVAH